MRFIEVFLNSVNKIHFLVVLFSACVLLSTCLLAGAVSPLFFAAILLLLGIGILRIAHAGNREDSGFALQLFTFVFSVTIIATCLIYLYYVEIYGTPYETGGTDDATFERKANILLSSGATTYEDAKDVIRLAGSGTWSNAGNYVIVVALVHKLVEGIGLEAHTLNPRLLNGFCLGMTAVLTWGVARRCCKYEQPARFAGYYAGLISSSVFTAAHIYRDVLVGLGVIMTAALTVALFGVFRSTASHHRILRITALLVAITCCVILTGYLREGGELLPIMIALMIAVQIKSPVLRLGSFALLVVIAIIAVTQGILTQPLNRGAFLIEYYTQYRARMGSGSGFGTGIYRLPPLLSYPLRVVYASFQPIPFPSGLISEDYRRLGTLVWFFGLPYLLDSLRSSIRAVRDSEDYYLRSVVVAFLCYYMVVALITMQVRQITMFVPAGSVLIAAGIEKSAARVSSRFILMAGLGVLLAVLYVVFKLA